MCLPPEDRVPEKNMDQETSTALQYKKLVLNKVQNKFEYLLIGLGITFFLTLSLLMPLLKKTASNAVSKEKTATTVAIKTLKMTEAKTYIVKRGDYLWNIAVANYGSGYKAYDIAKANNISNPSLIEPGQVLTLPNLQPVENGQIGKGISTAKVTIKGETYKVQKGDFLWNIAEKAYGDGFMWVRIAKANSIADPNILYSGTILKLPRD